MAVELSPKELEQMYGIFKQIPELGTVILFGSRATGENRVGSDVDLAVKSKNGEPLEVATISRLQDLLEEETLIPYFFDVLDYHTLQNPNLKKEIQEKGVLIWPSQNN